MRASNSAISSQKTGAGRAWLTNRQQKPPIRQFYLNLVNFILYNSLTNRAIACKRLPPTGKVIFMGFVKLKPGKCNSLDLTDTQKLCKTGKESWEWPGNAQHQIKLPLYGTKGFISE